MSSDGADVGAVEALLHGVLVQSRHRIGRRVARALVERRNPAVASPQKRARAACKVGKSCVVPQIGRTPGSLGRQRIPNDGHGRQELGGGRLGVEGGCRLAVVAQLRKKFRADVDVGSQPASPDPLDRSQQTAKSVRRRLNIRRRTLHGVQRRLEYRLPVLVQYVAPCTRKLGRQRVSRFVAAIRRRRHSVAAFVKPVLRQQRIEPKDHGGGEPLQHGPLMDIGDDPLLLQSGTPVVEPVGGPPHLPRNEVGGLVDDLPRRRHKRQQVDQIGDAAFDESGLRPTPRRRAAPLLMHGVSKFQAALELSFDLRHRPAPAVFRNANGNCGPDSVSAGRRFQAETGSGVPVGVPAVERGLDRHRPSVRVGNQNVEMLPRRVGDCASLLHQHVLRRLAPFHHAPPQRRSERLVEGRFHGRSRVRHGLRLSQSKGIAGGVGASANEPPRSWPER